MPAEIEINTIAKTLLDPTIVDNGWLAQVFNKYPMAVRTFSVPGLVQQVIPRASGKVITRLRIFGHGAEGEQMVGGGFGSTRDSDIVSDAQSCIMLTRGVLNCASELAMLRRYFTPMSVVELHGCEVGKGTKGVALCRALARLWGVTVLAGCEDQRSELVFTGRYLSVDTSGEAHVGGNGGFLLISGATPAPSGDELEPWPVLAPKTMLSDVSMARYGTYHLWPLIWDYNRALIGPNPNRVPANITLRIRKKERYTQAERAAAERRSPTWKNYPT